MTLAEQEAFEAAEVIIRFLREHVEEGANVMHFAALSPDSDEQTIRELILEAQDLIDKCGSTFYRAEDGSVRMRLR